MHLDGRLSYAGWCGDDAPTLTLDMAALGAGSAIMKGAPADFTHVERIFVEICEALNIGPEQPHSMVVSVPVYSTPTHVENLVDLIFTLTAAPRLLIVNPWMATLLANGQTSGVVISLGHTATAITAVVRMRLQQDAVVLLPYGGDDIVNQPEGISVLCKVRVPWASACLSPGPFMCKFPVPRSRPSAAVSLPMMWRSALSCGIAL